VHPPWAAGTVVLVCSAEVPRAGPCTLLEVIPGPSTDLGKLSSSQGSGLSTGHPCKGQSGHWWVALTPLKQGPQNPTAPSLMLLLVLE